MLKGEPVEVRLKALKVSIKGCFATKKDAAGNSTEVFRLMEQPVQVFGEKPKAEEEGNRTGSVSSVAASDQSLHGTDPWT